MMCLKVNSNNLYLLFISALFLFHLGCTRQKKNNNTDNYPPIRSEEIRYANGFSIDYYDNYTKVTINNPWASSNTPYETYYLFKDDSLKNEFILPGDGVKLTIPLKSVSVNTFSYFEFLSLINELETVTGVTDGHRIYNPIVLRKLDTGEIVDLGDPFSPNIERTLALMPDALINSAYAQLDGYSERLTKIGLPVIYSIEWMENNPLARAEWIKMIAAFYDKSEMAEVVFNDIEKRYKDNQSIGKDIDIKTHVLSGDNFQDTWYIPGGKSYKAMLFKDAGLKYRYEDNDQSGSIGLDIESVLTLFGDADIWLGCSSDSYAELAIKDSKYNLLKPVKNRRVFNNHNRVTPSGGNDYFESAIAHPDLVLSDIIKAAYPELLPEYSFTYIKPLD